MSKYGVLSGPYFPACGLNTERYGVEKTIVENTAQKNLRIWTLFTQSEITVFYAVNCYTAQTGVMRDVFTTLLNIYDGAFL